MLCRTVIMFSLNYFIAKKINTLKKYYYFENVISIDIYYIISIITTIKIMLPETYSSRFPRRVFVGRKIDVGSWEGKKKVKRREKGCAKGRMYSGAGNFFHIRDVGRKNKLWVKKVGEKGRREGLKFGKKEK